QQGQTGCPSFQSQRSRWWRPCYDAERNCFSSRCRQHSNLVSPVNSGFKLSRGKKMKATQLLHNLGQSLWLDNITASLINSGTLKRYIDELSVTGLTSNPTIFDHAIKNSSSYDTAIRKKLDEGKSGEELFFELALEDLTRAADLFRPIFDRTNGV